LWAGKPFGLWCVREPCIEHWAAPETQLSDCGRPRSTCLEW
jgi:hypothetical protein